MTSEQNSDFKWLPEYDDLLARIASTDDAKNAEWTKLRDIIKYKIEKNVSVFLSTTQKPPTPPPFPPVNLPTGGLKLAPFPPRRLSQMHLNEVPISYMTPEQADEMKKQVFLQLDEFMDGPPFTIQRLCELCVNPKKHYRAVGKYLRAVEKSILVTSSWDSFPAYAEGDTDTPFRSGFGLNGQLESAPSTPLFSPIPFLHDDARRSKSRSPPPTPLSLGPVASASDPHIEPIEVRALGLVDELDDPSPGHLSEHPTALSSVTTLGESSSTEKRPIFASLEQRFVKADEVKETKSEKMEEDKENSVS